MPHNEYRSTPAWPYHISCGGVVYREGPAGREFALLVRHGGKRGSSADSWHLPKGTLSREETLEQAAGREIREESGLDVEVGAYLGAIHSRFTHPRRKHFIEKTTHYFLCQWTGGTAAMDDEHDAVEWKSAPEALALLAQVPKQEGTMLERAAQWLEERAA